MTSKDGKPVVVALTTMMTAFSERTKCPNESSRGHQAHQRPRNRNNPAIIIPVFQISVPINLSGLARIRSTPANTMAPEAQLVIVTRATNPRTSRIFSNSAINNSMIELPSQTHQLSLSL